MMILYKRKLNFLSILFIGALVFTSCKSSKILTDASTARNKDFKGNVQERYAALMNVDEKDIRNEKLYRFIDDWMGVPNVPGRMDKKGADCSGFTVLLQKEIYNRQLPRTASQMAESIKRKYEDELKEGDLVFFNFNGQKFNHVGIYLQNNRFVHVSTSKGVIVSNLKDPWYYKYFSRGGL
ncbi:NlpC/P60 family protein [Pedobacter sp. P351]|uniref:C40 family peptidase n=1 Tax=Pedobacter superstes TaxID=3133441 RepID=UPI003098A7A1